MFKNKNPTGLTENQKTMKPTLKSNVLREKAVVGILLSIVMLSVSQPARAINYEGAFYVDSPSAVTTLQSRGFNVFMVPGGLSHSNIQATLAAITPPAGAIVVLNGFDDSGASAFMDW